MSKIFSVSYEHIRGQFSRKIINLFGLKIKFKNPMITDIEIPYRNINKNMLYFIFSEIAQFSPRDLFILKNDYVCFIFNNEILKWDLKKAENYILNCFGSMFTILNFEKIDYSSNLYKEHTDRIKNGEFLWKYTNRDYLVKFNYLSFENGAVYVNEKILDENFLNTHYLDIYFKVSDSKKIYIDGITVREYIDNMNYDRKKEIIIKLLKYIFDNYSDVRGLCYGLMFDCNLCNFIINKNDEFVFIDDDYVSRSDIDYEYVIYYMLKDYSDELYNDVMKHFALKDKYRYKMQYGMSIKANKPELEEHVRQKLKPSYDFYINKYFK